MPLPSCLEVLPLATAPRAAVSVPGSKSVTNRALVLAALAAGTTRLDHALWSEDTEVMVEALRALGLAVDLDADLTEPSNRTITVHGMGGAIAPGGPEDAPRELFVGNAGTAARFLSALVCLGQGAYRLAGVARMHERPQAALFDALRELGYRVDSPNNRLPAVVHGTGPRALECRVSIVQSSQFASALALCASAGRWTVRVVGENAEESPYVTMTSELMRVFPRHGGVFAIEPDASSGSYFLAADALWRAPGGPAVRVLAWPTTRWQIDADFPRYIPLPAELSRQRHLGDSILTAMVLAPFAAHPVRFTDLGRLRLQECERVAAMRTELVKCGARVTETGDTLEVEPSPLHGATVETYDDHRIAMCFATLGLKVAGIRLHNPACVKKTFPDFFQKLAAPPPAGLGASLLDVATGRPLTSAQLAVP